jgi:hypothetical protein
MTMANDSTPRESMMSVRTYRITAAGEQVELSNWDVVLGEPYLRPITDVWPVCACRRCEPPGGSEGHSGEQCD